MKDRVVYLDCVGGVAGDMLLAALVDAHGSSECVEQVAASLGFDDLRLEWSSIRPGGLSSRHLEVRFDPAKHPHQRTLGEIESIIARSSAPSTVQEAAKAVFETLAAAEAKVHGEEITAVHFHEVGAVDAVVDILGVCTILDAMGAAEIVCSPLPMGHGTIETAHGVLPLPAPAVAAMLPGIPVFDAGVEGETVTPTGLALVKTLADRFGRMPSLTISSMGVGGGSRQYEGLPNIVRAFQGHTGQKESTPEPKEIVMVECNVDDLDPRVLPVLLERLLAVGALDAYLTPLIMKKGRPGHLITAMVDSGQVDAAISVLLRESSTLGCRTYPVQKYHLQRRMETVTTPWGEVPVKVALSAGGRLRSVPEFEACAQLARDTGVPVRDILAAATDRDSKSPPEDSSGEQ